MILIPRIDDKHLDSFWYYGVIAKAGNLELIANGDIRVYQDDINGNYIGMFDGKARDGFIMPEDDEQLAALYGSENGYNMVDNNWFEIVNEYGDSVSDIYDNYDEALSALKELYEAQ